MSERIGDLLRDSQVVPRESGENQFVASVPVAWTVFDAFGGMLLALALRAIQSSMATDGKSDIISASATFAAPVPAGPVAIDVSCVRNSRRSPAFVATLSSGTSGEDTPPAVWVMATAGPRERTDASIMEYRLPTRVSAPTDAAPLGENPISVVPLLQQSEWRQISNPNLVGSEVHSWLRYHRPPRRPDGIIDRLSHCLAADILAPAIFKALPDGTAPFNLRTLQLDIQFFFDTSDEWTFQRTRALHVDSEFAFGTVELWDEAGQLIAVAQQRAACVPFPNNDQSGEHVDQ